MGYGIRLRGSDQVELCFFGDGAVNEGAFHEALNVSALWDLPVVYVIENNRYGMGTAPLLLDEVAQHHREQVGQSLVVVVPKDLRGPALRAQRERLVEAVVEDGDELGDRPGVPDVRGEGRAQIDVRDGEPTPVQVLAVVHEHVQPSTARLAVEREERRPPPLSEVLSLVNHDRVVPRTEPLGSLRELPGQLVLEVVGPGVRRRLREVESGLISQAHAEPVEVLDVEMRPIADALSELVAKSADVVVGALDIPIEEASRFGVISVAEDYRITEFNEKPANATSIPGDLTKAFASMGIYLFKSKSLREELIADAQEDTAHDFGKNIIPRMINTRRVYAFKFQDANRKAVKYWRDIGTLDAYWEANLDLVAVDPLFNLYDQQWPIRTYQGQYPPAKFVFAQDYQGGRM